MKKAFTFIVVAALLAGMQACDMNKYNTEDDGLNNMLRSLINSSREELNSEGFALRLAYSASGEAISNVVYSRKGDNCRWDAFDQDHIYAVYYIPSEEKGWEYESATVKAIEDGWKETDMASAKSKIEANYDSLIGDASEILKDYGFSKTGQEKVFGIPCDVWSGTYTVPAGKSPVTVYGAMTLSEGTQGEFCVWNGLTLRTSVNGKVQTECYQIVKNLPAKAFTNTRDLSWLD